MNRTNVYRIEQTGINYSHESLTKLSKALGISISALFDEAGAGEFGRMVPIDFYTPEMIRRDAEGNTVIDPPAHTAGKISNVLLTDGSFADNSFAFTVGDEAMRPHLAPGDVVIVDPNLKPEPNDLVLAVVHRTGSGKSHAIIRRYAERANGFELQPNDNAYAAEVPMDNNIGLVGTVVEQRRQRRR